MKRIKRFENFIEESYLSGSRAPLYHSTEIYFASQILDQDLLAGRNTGRGDFEKVISLTRDKNFIYDNYPVTFVLDQDALKKEHNIVPFDYFAHQKGLSKDNPYFAPYSVQKSNPKRKDFEFEETLKGDIKNLHKYLLEVRLNDTISLYKNAKPNTREEFREAYEDLMYSLRKYKDQYGIKVVDSKGKEYPIEVEELAEGVYNKNSGTRVYYTKAADEDSYKVYYSSYKPIVGKTPDEFMEFLKGNGIEHTKSGGNAVKMNKAGIEKLKKSMLNLQEKLVMDVEPEVKNELDHLFHIDDPLTKAINIIVKPAHDMAQKGESRPDSMLNKQGEIKAAKELRNAYFPGQAQFVNDAHFNALAKHNKIYYRGVHDKKFVDDLKYNITNFMGHSNEFQGTWMTDDKEYAKGYHYDEHPLEIIVKPDANIASEKVIDSKRNEYMRKMMQLQDYADKEIEGDRFKEVHHQAHYLKDYLMNTAVLALALHYDGVRLDHDDAEILIMFNREKLVVRNPEQ